MSTRNEEQPETQDSPGLLEKTKAKGKELGEKVVAAAQKVAIEGMVQSLEATSKDELAALVMVAAAKQEA
ncbi:MAG: hypothetical protein AAGC55_10765, partial [Myxococcota bacterium]